MTAPCWAWPWPSRRQGSAADDGATTESWLQEVHVMQRTTLEGLGDFTEEPWLATLATHREDGTILLSPVWWEWDGEAFWVGVPVNDIKSRHVQRDPRIALSIAEEAAYPGRGLEVGAEARVVDDPGATRFRRIATKYLGSDVADEWMHQFGDRHEWVALRIPTERVRAWDHRDEALLLRAAPQRPRPERAQANPKR